MSRRKVISMQEHLRGKFSKRRNAAIDEITATAHAHGMTLVGVITTLDDREDIVALVAHQCGLDGEKKNAANLVRWAIESLEEMEKKLRAEARASRKKSPK